MNAVAVEGGPSGAVSIRKIAADQPWQWLSASCRDVGRNPVISLGYGLVFALVSFVIAAGLYSIDAASLVLALAAGFMLIGPMLAVGLYEASRRLEAGLPLSAKDVIFVKTRSPTQIAFLGALLMVMLLAWMQIAFLLFMLFFGLDGLPPLDDFVSTLLLTWRGLGLLIIGSLVGAAIAFLVFSVSAISVPLLMVRDMDAVTAIITSVRAVQENPKPMILWALIVAALTAVGIGTLFIGLIVTFPLVGHATWHAYRCLVEER